MKMQEILKERKLLDGKIDGVFGQKTRWALTGLERSIGLPELGVPTTLLYDILIGTRQTPWKCDRNNRSILPQKCSRIGLDD
jgi:hypothetical protein